MKRVFGFALFFVALGMVIMMFIPRHIYRNSDRSAVPPCRISQLFVADFEKNMRTCRETLKKAFAYAGLL